MFPGRADFIREQGGGGTLRHAKLAEVAGVGKRRMQLRQEVGRFADAGAEQAREQLRPARLFRQMGKFEGPQRVMQLAHERRIFQDGIGLEGSHGVSRPVGREWAACFHKSGTAFPIEAMSRWYRCTMSSKDRGLTSFMNQRFSVFST